jgi:hypothetical protein
LIQAQNWQQAQRKFNEALQQMARMLNQIYTGANIPNTRLVSGTKIDGVEEGADVTGDHSADVDALQTQNAPAEAGADVTATHQAATIASQGGLATEDDIGSGIDVAAVWRKIYDNTLSSAVTTISITSLDGNTDGEWILQIMGKWAGVGAGSIRVTFNNDIGNNYGYEYIAAADGATTVGNSEGTDHWYLCSFTATNEVSWGRMRIYAKSGLERMGVTHIVNECDGIGVGENMLLGNIWSNTADNITEIDLTATTASAIDAGTRVIMYKRVA